MNEVEIRNSRIHGKGVFATQKLLKGTILKCDVLLVSRDETCLATYHYPWGKNHRAICIGFASFLNHSNFRNTKIVTIDKENYTKSFVLLTDVNIGEELFIKYPYEL